MSVFQSISIGEGWISEHFFTSDSPGSFQTKVKDRLKQWAEQEAANHQSPRSRFAKARRELSAELATLEEETATGSARSNHRAQELLLDILGYQDGHGLTIAREGPLVKVSVPGGQAQGPLAVVLANPVDTAEDLLAKDQPTLPKPVKLTEDGDQLSSVAQLLIGLFNGEEPPAFALVLAGRIALLADKEHCAEGRYLAVNLQLVAERNDTRKGGEIDTALTCLEARSLIPDAEGGIWWQRMLAESVKHTIGVSKDLRDGVRMSIELLAQEVVDRRQDQGLDPLPQAQASTLARQALRFLYRILFLLYAEASPELEVLPVGAPEYDQGYSLDRLRELVQIKLATPQAKVGTHFYQSLSLLFRLVDQGHAASGQNDLVFNPLRADLFKPEVTGLIDQVGLGNDALQQVLANLLLSKEQRGQDRGYISYAELSINQLGAVYESLMSYTGFFAETDLFEVAKGGDNSKGSWVVPASRVDGISETDFVRRPDPITGEEKPVLHRQGSFVFRLAGRERQQSASYYTPEVLTKFTVRQALDELLDQDGPTPAASMLKLTVCEPALGSGAFAIEATRQLAERYLHRRQEELGQRIDPETYPRELQKTKAYIALHNVYGVDLNATAVELAEISLWLDTMVSGLAAPWFGLHLRRGNSLIGARRAVYSPSQVQNRSWLTTAAVELPMPTLALDIEAGVVGSGLEQGIHHFLLPAAGWGSATEASQAKNLAAEQVKALKEWRGAIKHKPTAKQLVALQSLAIRVETLWQFALQRLRIAEEQSRRAIEVWGHLDPTTGGTIQREEIEQTLAQANGAFERLRRVMDAWCALWFWPLTDQLTSVASESGQRPIYPPTLDEWIAGLRAVLGSAGNKAAWGMATLAPTATWDELGQTEAADLDWATAQSIDQAKRLHPWLEVCERIAAQQGFFHWELDFATVFARGGFDLQVGNPPWVRPDWDAAASLGEFDPRAILAGRKDTAQERTLRESILTVQAARNGYVDDEATMISTRAFLSSPPEYPHLEGLRPDTYRCFMEQVWRHASPGGRSALVHPESHFTDEKAGLLREATYRRLRRHWQFKNELLLFSEIDDKKMFGVHVYGAERSPRFLTAASLYHPDTVIRSLDHDGSGDSPGLKDPEGHWDLRPHRSRIISVNLGTLKTWNAIIEEGQGVPEQTRMVYAVNTETEAVLEKLAQTGRINSLGLKFSQGWNETTDRQRGRFEIRWEVPAGWKDVILKGPHFHIANPT
ncbi:MAG: class I SAM-dependent DNA methyltransferase, partial [Micrococcales bacterium]|nr:class I SAM-dependent DNA methyltransferase [Micrococcales bacterium]